MAFFAQSQGSGAISTVILPLRIENALLSYVVYIRQIFWPVGLEWFYIYPTSIPMWQAISAAVLLVILSALAVYLWRSRPYIATGWFWYLGTLVPVIGLVQIGAQSHADRYTYIPITGLTILLAWGCRRRRRHDGRAPNPPWRLRGALSLRDLRGAGLRPGLVVAGR